MSIWPVISLASCCAFYLAHRAATRRQCEKNCCTYCNCGHDAEPLKLKGNNLKGNKLKASLFQKYWPFGEVGTTLFVLACLITVVACLGAVLQIIYPSWIWNPFLWGRYKVYETSDIQATLKGVNTKYKLNDSGMPLGLPEDSWEELSAGALSSYNETDVKAVVDGIAFGKKDTSGIIINILARDTIDAIQSLRENVEGLFPFFSKIAVVVFENDSVDGTREAFQNWGSEVEDRYVVDVMECEESPGCIFGESHRYDSLESKDYFTSSAIGKMALYRQRISDYIITNPKYQDFSHMLVLDLDLAVTISPLGVLHSLGLMPHSVVASSGRQVWPGSLGTLIPPYDFTAVKFHENQKTKLPIKLHDMFCGLQPPGDRWRNMCHAPSAMLLVLVLLHDTTTEPYEVISAYNGATLYPLDIVRDSGAQYDAGDDGQQCEHVGFHLSLNSPIIVNPKWTFHIRPTRPGGPRGRRATKNIIRIALQVNVSLIIFLQQAICVFFLVYLTSLLVIYLVYPLWYKIISGTKFKAVLMSGDPGKAIDLESEELINEYSRVIEWKHTPITQFKAHQTFEQSSRKRKELDTDLRV